MRLNGDGRKKGGRYQKTPQISKTLETIGFSTETVIVMGRRTVEMEGRGDADKNIG